MYKPLKPEAVDTIVIHVSDSNFGNVKTIDEWHKERGWEGIGYHFAITNCFPTVEDLKNKTPDINSDGQIHEGRPEEFRGAHVRGHNWHTIGVVLIGASAGDNDAYGALFTSKQLVSAAELIFDLEERFTNIQHIKGHYELDPDKGCPLMAMDYFRDVVKIIRYGE